MSDLNDIFGYKVYKPPPEKNLPMIADLNVYGEVVTLIDPNADVIKDPAVQKIFKSLDGERTVKIEDLPPDVRYDGWNKKAQYDKQVIVNNASNARSNVQPQQPFVNQNLLRENENAAAQYNQEALKQAQLKALNAKNNELEFSRQLQETRIALEKEISKQLIEQLAIRAQKQSVTPEQQALIEKLYLDLRLINADLAFGILKTFSNVEPSAEPLQPPPLQPSQQQQLRELQQQQLRELQQQQLKELQQQQIREMQQQQQQQQLAQSRLALAQLRLQTQQAQQKQAAAAVPQPKLIAKPVAKPAAIVDELKAAKIRSSRK